MPVSEILIYHNLLNLLNGERMAVSKLKASSVMPSARVVPLVWEHYDSAAQRMDASIRYLTRHASGTLDQDTLDLANEVFKLGSGDENLWEKAEVRLVQQSRERRLFAANQAVLDELLAELDGLVADVSQHAAAAPQGQANSSYRIALLITGIIGVLGPATAAAILGARGARSRLLPTLGVAIAAVVALTVIGWMAATTPTDSSQAKEDGEILATAFGISRHAGAMVTAGSQPTSLPMTQENLERLSASISKQQATLQQEVGLLDGRGFDQRTARIRWHVDALASNAARVEQGRPGLLRLLLEGRDGNDRIKSQIENQLDAALVTGLDDQLYRMVHGDDGTGGPDGWTAGAVPVSEILTYHHLFHVLDGQRIAVSKLKGSATLTSPHVIPLIWEDTDSAAQRMDTSIGYLTRHAPATLDQETLDRVNELLEMGSGGRNFWERSQTRLVQQAEERRLIAANQAALDELLAELHGLVTNVSQNAEAASLTQTNPGFRIALLVIGIVGVLGTLGAVAILGVRNSRS